MSFRLLITLILIAFLTPQSTVTYYNVVIEIIMATAFFLNYPDVKNFVSRFTWVCISLYMVTNLVAAL